MPPDEPLSGTMVMDEQNQQRMLFLQQLATPPPDSLLAMTLARYPSLANAYAAAVTAACSGEKQGTRQDFIDRLVKMYGEDDSLLSTLIQEASRHFDLIYSAQHPTKLSQEVSPGSSALPSQPESEAGKAQCVEDDDDDATELLLPTPQLPPENDEDQTWLDLRSKEPT